MRYFAFALGASVFALDIFTKWLVKRTPWLHDYVVIEDFFTIQYVRNEGIAFGLLHSVDSHWKPFLLSLVAVAAFLFVVYYIFHTSRNEYLSFIALGLLLRRILGNFTDRLLHQYVFDFLTLHWKDRFAWPTFNLADSAISVGVGLIVLKTILESRRSTAASVCIVALLFPASLIRSQPVSNDEILQSLQEKYEQIDSFAADFVQTFSSRGIEMKESGIVLMKRLGRMFWEYQEPTEKYFWADGRKTYFYVPKENQVLVTNMTLDEAESPLLFLLGKGDLQSDFHATVESSPESKNGSAQTYRLMLTPKQPHPEYTHLLLEIEKESFLIRKLTVFEPIGQQNEYILTNVRENIRISNKRFEMKLPSDVEVIEQ
jgi:signal peptidase II